MSGTTKSARASSGDSAAPDVTAADDVSGRSPGRGPSLVDPIGQAGVVDPMLSCQDQDGIRLAFLIHDVSRMRRSAYDQMAKPLGMTRSQWWVLAYLSRDDGMMQTQLADVLDVGKASLGELVEALEKRGWVERRPDPGDRRAKRVYLSPCAHTLIERMTRLEHEFNRQVLAEFSAPERRDLMRSLQKIKHSIAKRMPEAGISDPDT